MPCWANSHIGRKRRLGHANRTTSRSWPSILVARSHLIERLLLPVSEGTTYRLKRTAAEVAEPDGTDGENQRPDEKKDSIRLVALQLAEMSRATAFEDGRADER